MECVKIREACSAALDGEPASIPAGAIAAHLPNCPGCRSFVEDARALRGSFDTPLRADDMTQVILAAASAERHPRDLRTLVLRFGLVAIAAGQLVLAVPALLGSGGDAHNHAAHFAHELGAWDVALAVGFVFAAWRPLRAVGLFPFAVALAVGLAATAIADVIHGKATAITEATHVLALVGAGLLWSLVRGRSPARERHTLHTVRTRIAHSTTKG
jgi:predicted anti-sigma-YlaC factor YlaD